MTTTLVIPDLHAPYTHPDAVAFLRDLAGRYRPDTVVCLGDEIDSHAISRWPCDPDLPSPGDELRAAVETLKPLYAMFPSVFVCESNHTLRPWIRAKQSGLPGAVVRSVREVLQAPEGWNWRPYWRLGDVLYVHGEGFSGPAGAMRAMERYRSKTCIGHLHAHAGVQWAAGMFDTLWAMNSGCLIDVTRPAFAYAKSLPNRPCIGAGLIVDGVPRWVPLA